MITNETSITRHTMKRRRRRPFFHFPRTSLAWLANKAEKKYADFYLNSETESVCVRFYFCLMRCYHGLSSNGDVYNNRQFFIASKMLQKLHHLIKIVLASIGHARKWYSRIKCGQPATLRLALQHAPPFRRCHLICCKTYPRQHYVFVSHWMATNAILNSGRRGACRAPQKGGRRSNDCRRICFFRFFIIFISAAIDSASVLAVGCWRLERLSRILYSTFRRCNIIILFFFFSSVPTGLGINIYSAFPCIYILWQQRFCPFNFIIIIIRLAGAPWAWPGAWCSRAEQFAIECERYGRRVGCSWNGIPGLPLDRQK